MFFNVFGIVNPNADAVETVSTRPSNVILNVTKRRQLDRERVEGYYPTGQRERAWKHLVHGVSSIEH